MATSTSGSRRHLSGRTRLSREGILAAALDLVVEAGVPGLTMRALAARLDADPSAVYRYFRGKDDLVAALADALIAQLARTPSAAAGTGWRAEVQAAAGRLRDLLRDQPQLVPVVTGAPVTPATATATAAALALLQEELGLDAVQARRGLAALLAHVVGAALLDAAPPVAASEDPDPAGTGVGAFWSADAAERDTRFGFGLDLILDALVARATGPAPPAR